MTSDLTFGMITDKLNEFNSKLDSRIEYLRVKSREIEEIPYKLPRAEYESVMRVISDFHMNEVNNSERHYNILLNKIDDSKNKVEELREAINNYNIALNNNQTKFGLKGDIKSRLPEETKRKIKTGNLPNMTPEKIIEAQHHLRQPYALTPYQPPNLGDINGGKYKKTKKNRKTKKNKTKSK